MLTGAVKFFNGDLNTFLLLLRELIRINIGQNFEETPLPNRKSFYFNLNIENITKYDNEHAQNVWNIFEMTNY